jgi:hypothetical protein
VDFFLNLPSDGFKRAALTIWWEILNGFYPDASEELEIAFLTCHSPPLALALAFLASLTPPLMGSCFAH